MKGTGSNAKAQGREGAKDEKLEAATALKLASQRLRTKNADSPAVYSQLYNAACAFTFWQESRSVGDFDLMVDFANNLEEAAVFFAKRRAA
jgi:hypothetical protein